jgi:hypothetical protein
MNNGDIDLSPSRLPLERIIRKSGTVGDFRQLLKARLPSVKVVETPPGECVGV